VHDCGDFATQQRVQEVARKISIYLVNSINLSAGRQKTIMYRILEALRWEAPDDRGARRQLGNVSAFGKRSVN